MTALVLWALVVNAAPRLEYTREVPSCPDAAGLQRLVAERLGAEPFDPNGSRVMKVTIVKTSDGMTSSVRLYDADGTVVGERVLSGKGEVCDELAASTALAMAVAVDPFALTRPTPEKQSAPPIADLPSPPAPPLPIPDAEPLPLARRRTPEPIVVEATPEGALWLGLGGGANAGEVPAIAALFHLEAAWERQSWAVGLRAAASSVATLPFGAGQIQGNNLSVGPFFCLQSKYVGICGTTRLGPLFAKATGLLNSTSESAFWMAIGVEPYVELGLSAWLRARLRLGVALQPVRTVLLVGPERAWDMPSISGTLSLSFHIRAFEHRASSSTP